MSDDDVWFEPKRVGYGSGSPVRWQGWALLIGFVAAVTATTLLMPRHPIEFAVIFATLSAAFCMLCARHTRGGWRWRG